MIKTKRKNVFKCIQIETNLYLQSITVSTKISKTSLLASALIVFPPRSTPPQVQARKHQTKFWINCLIIPYSITATPNLANTLQRTLIHTCAAYPLCYLWDVADKWQRCLSANPEPLARQGMCVWVCICLCVLLEKQKIVEGHGEMEGSAGKILAFWLVEVNILQSYGFFDRKDSLLRPCCSADYEKQHIFFLYKYTPSICAGKICYLAIYGFSWWGTVTGKQQRTQKQGGGENRRIREVKVAKGKTFNWRSVFSAIMAGGW